MHDVWIALIVSLWLVVVVLALLLAGALRQIGLLTIRLGDDPGALITDIGLERGTRIPTFEGIDADTRSTFRSDELSPTSRVLVFVSPACLACRTLMPHLNEVMATRPEYEFLAVCRGDADACARFKHGENLHARMVVDTTGAIERAFDIQMTPFVYVASDSNRVLIRGVANDWRHLESLLEQEGTLQESPWRLVEEGSAAT